MSGRTMFALSGIALLAGGVAGIVAHILHLQYHPMRADEVLPYVTKSEPVHVLLFAAVLLVMLGLPGLLVRQSEQIGRIGVAGYVLLYFGLIFAEGLHCVLEFGIYPAMAHDMPNEMIAVVNRMYGGSPYSYLETWGGPALLFGVLILGASMWHAAILPRWTAFLLLATDFAALLAYVPATHWIVLGRYPVVLYLAFAAIGYCLVTGTRSQSVCPTGDVNGPRPAQS